jgi:hypothetical protein
VTGFGSLWVVVGSLWGRCGSLWVVVGRCGSLWVVVGRCGVVVGGCGSFHVLVTTGTQKVDSSNRCHSMIHHQNADAMVLASASLRG